MSSEPYQVVNSQKVADEFRDLLERAASEGRLAAALLAGRTIIRALTLVPGDFGESMGELPFSGASLRRGVIDPLTVYFAVNEAERIVFIRWFHLRSEKKG